MNVFQFDFFYNKNTILKKKLLPLTALFCLLNLNAQVTFRIESGVLLKTDSDNLGLLLNIEPKVKASENTVIGLRFGIAINPQKIRIDNSTSFFIDELDDNSIISFVSTYDYYLNAKNHRPYVGLGLGYYLFNDIDISDRNSGSTDILEGSVKNKLGFLLRGGLEIRNTRYGLEYNFIPKADIKIPNGQTVGTIDNSYFGLSIGFTIGGGKNSI
ncbi:hypothetical protein BFR04_04865 [Gaetbulibacter sp. 4G1]|nr:hypothetical protein [Gaetbulibacter sp. 4G1]PIA78866.1 hypothetical protein BFR04_04865 [Gaetbulibacter sp. 4G1]